MGVLYQMSYNGVLEMFFGAYIPLGCSHHRLEKCFFCPSLSLFLSDGWCLRPYHGRALPTELQRQDGIVNCTTAAIIPSKLFRGVHRTPADPYGFSPTELQRQDGIVNWLQCTAQTSCYVDAWRETRGDSNWCLQCINLFLILLQLLIIRIHLG